MTGVLEPVGTPRACGALGSFDQGALDRMSAAVGEGLREVHRDERSVLMLDREPIRWGTLEDGGVGWSERLPETAGAARDWEQAASAGGLGLVLDHDRRALHASASGVGPLYSMIDGEAVYFCTAIDPLVHAASARLSVDWSSWASIIALGYSPGDGTPFNEIRRLDPLARIEVAPGMASTRRPGRLAWVEAEPMRPAEAQERILAAMREEIAGLDPAIRVCCPLSGGWDSRLLLCLLAERELELSAHTVNSDFGDDLDERLAEAVAARVGVPHELVRSGERRFRDELVQAADWVDHESMLHLALYRLADQLPTGSVAVDGLAGDVLLKNLFITPEVLAAPDWRGALEVVFTSFVPPGGALPLLDVRAWEALEATARTALVEEGRRFADHPAAATLTIYWTRTRRGVSQAPTRLIGRNHRLAMPFLADGCARAALSIPPGDKADRRFYRELLGRVDRDVARLPSTNDEHPPAGAERPRLSRSRPARRTYLDLLAANPLRPWFSASLSDALDAGKLGRIARSFWRAQRMQNLCTLSLWAERYTDVLTDSDPGELLGPPPARPYPAAPSIKSA
jgi:asparagine synthetase B (glutamine-hydrolysing)